MNVFISRHKLILIIMALVSIIDIFDRNILKFFGISNNAFWDMIANIGYSLVEILLVLWAFLIGKKIILKAKKKEKHYRRLIEFSPEAIIIHREGKIIFSNQAGLKLLGANSLDEILNLHWRELIDDESYERFKSLGDGPVIDHSYKARKLDGTIIDLEISSINIDYKGEPAIELIARDVTVRKSQEDGMKQLIYYDALTGLPNRRFFIDTLQQMVENPEKCNYLFAVMFIDLDGFKQVNDTYGHEAGDKVLQEVAEYLRSCVRVNDTVARLAGDEFTILLPGANQNDCISVAKEILAKFNRTSKDIFVTASIGIALFPHDGHDPELLIKQADMAMYQAKQDGKNCYRFVQKSTLSI